MPANKKHEKEINLLPQEEFEASTLGRILRWLLSTFRFLVITTEMIVITAFLSRFYFDSKAGDLNDEIKQKQDFLATFSDFEKKFRATQKKLNVFSQMTQDGNLVSGIVQSISSKTPTDIALTSINFTSDKQVNIQANGLDEQSISQFITNLGAESKLNDISLVSASSDNKSSFTTFTVNSTLKEENK